MRRWRGPWITSGDSPSCRSWCCATPSSQERSEKFRRLASYTHRCPFRLPWWNNRWVSIPGLPGGFFFFFSSTRAIYFPSKDTYARKLSFWIFFFENLSRVGSVLFFFLGLFCIFTRAGPLVWLVGRSVGWLVGWFRIGFGALPQTTKTHPQLTEPHPKATLKPLLNQQHTKHKSAPNQPKPTQSQPQTRPTAAWMSALRFA